MTTEEIIKELEKVYPNDIRLVEDAKSLVEAKAQQEMIDFIKILKDK